MMRRRRRGGRGRGRGRVRVGVGGEALVALDVAPRDGLGLRSVLARVPVAEHLPRAQAGL